MMQGRRRVSDDTNVVQFPPPPEQPDLLLPPMESRGVVVEGRLMPHLTGYMEGDNVWLVVDHRFACGPFDAEQARQAARLAGQAMAVVAGFPHLGAEGRGQPFAPLVMQIAPPPGEGGA